MPGDGEGAEDNSMKQQHRSIAEAIQFTQYRLAAFRQVLATREQRLLLLTKEREAVDGRIGSLEKACAQAPGIIARLEEELTRLRTVDSQRLAVGGAGRYQPSRSEQLIKRRQQLLRRLAEVEASLPPELRGGA
jgi:chromosome segregation ATPase